MAATDEQRSTDERRAAILRFAAFDRRIHEEIYDELADEQRRRFSKPTACPHSLYQYWQCDYSVQNEFGSEPSSHSAPKLLLLTSDYNKPQAMPVHLDTHDPDIDLTPGTTKSDIVAFLYSNPKYGYRPAELGTHLDIPHGTATTTLKRLHEAGYIGKTEDSYYHALEGREALRRYVASLDQLDRLFTQPTDEDHPPTSDTEGAPPDGRDDAAVERELAALEDDLEE